MWVVAHHWKAKLGHCPFKRVAHFGVFCGWRAPYSTEEVCSSLCGSPWSSKCTFEHERRKCTFEHQTGFLLASGSPAEGTVTSPTLQMALQPPSHVYIPGCPWCHDSCSTVMTPSPVPDPAHAVIFSCSKAQVGLGGPLILKKSQHNAARYWHCGSKIINHVKQSHMAILSGRGFSEVFGFWCSYVDA